MMPRLLVFSVFAIAIQGGVALSSLSSLSEKQVVQVDAPGVVLLESGGSEDHSRVVADEIRPGGPMLMNHTLMTDDVLALATQYGNGHGETLNLDWRDEYPVIPSFVAQPVVRAPAPAPEPIYHGDADWRGPLIMSAAIIVVGGIVTTTAKVMS
mmetsp:Transcript_74508/g.177403  ORF Transcript_74508/g.177403 Transcript_74508/m.177403 type:complete len:154 (-) Transcript_74508:74-535(-)